MIAECLFGMGDIESAKRLTNRAIELSKDSVGCSARMCYEGIFLLGKISESMGDFEAAREYYQQTVSIAPDRDYFNALEELELLPVAE